MTNQQFLNCIKLSFNKFLETGSRSNEKLIVLHGAIARHLLNVLGAGYSVNSLGIGDGKEKKIKGRYIDKTVDITIIHNSIPIAGIGVKFVMQNYSQNSNNYFENMLGETANLRSCKIPYFQIFIIPDKIPYYNNSGEFKKWETFSGHNSSKYMVLSQDNIETFVHTPTKTLLFVIKLPEIDIAISNRDEYNSFYTALANLTIRPTAINYGTFESTVIFNDYPLFIEKVVHYIKSL